MTSVAPSSPSATRNDRPKTVDAGTLELVRVPQAAPIKLGSLTVQLHDGENVLWRGPYLNRGLDAEQGCYFGCVPARAAVRPELEVVITERRVIINHNNKTHTPSEKGCCFYLLCCCCCYNDVTTTSDSLLVIDAHDIKGAFVSSLDVTDKRNCMLCCGGPAVKTTATTVRLQLHSMSMVPLKVAPPTWGLDGDTIDGIVVDSRDVNRVLDAINRMMAAAGSK